MAESESVRKRSGFMKWVALGAILIVGLVIYLFFVPYRTMTLVIDRQTGALTSRSSYYGIPFWQDHPVAVPTRGHPIGKVPMTAPTRSIKVLERTKRFLWTESYTEHKDEDGRWFAEAYYQLFYCAASPHNPKAKQLSDEEIERLIRQRIAFWNSSDLDRNPRGVAEAAKLENSELLGVPVDYFFIE